jgi:hypothetical protein
MYWFSRSRAVCTRMKEGANQFSACFAAARLGSGRTGAKRPLQLRLPYRRLRRQEREIERGLLAHLRDLLLELGRGFALVGSQVPLEVADETFYLDLLFYHVGLLLRDRTQDRAIQARLGWQVELLPVFGRRSAALGSGRPN